MALLITLSILWPVAILFLLLCALCLYAVKPQEVAGAPSRERKVQISATVAPFSLYADVEQCLAAMDIPEQVIDGCMGLLKQYVAQGGVECVEITECASSIYITLLPQNIVVKVK